MTGKTDFLTLAEVIEIQNNQIMLYGGEPGMRDITLLQSAMAIPESTFEGRYLHADIFEMAAAYAFHICQMHPFPLLVIANLRSRCGDLSGYPAKDRAWQVYQNAETAQDVQKGFYPRSIRSLAMYRV